LHSSGINRSAFDQLDPGRGLEAKAGILDGEAAPEPFAPGRFARVREGATA